jgi:hypothetical protein
VRRSNGADIAQVQVQPLTVQSLACALHTCCLVHNSDDGVFKGLFVGTVEAERGRAGKAIGYSQAALEMAHKIGMAKHAERAGFIFYVPQKWATSGERIGGESQRSGLKRESSHSSSDGPRKQAGQGEGARGISLKTQVSTSTASTLEPLNSAHESTDLTTAPSAPSQDGRKRRDGNGPSVRRVAAPEIARDETDMPGSPDVFFSFPASQIATHVPILSQGAVPS